MLGSSSSIPNEFRGPAGRDGKPGKDGKPGEKGDKGDTGLTGPVGPIGPKGEPGEQGPRGEKGEKGDRGELGPIGLTGPAGKDGLPGKDGKPGAAGKDGLPGRDGKDGKDGKDGRDGKDGKDGLPGKDGRDGEDAPFSTWLELHELKGVTNAESHTAIVFDGELASEKAHGIEVTLVGRGPNQKNFFYGKKNALAFNGFRVDTDVAQFNPRRSNPALNCEIRISGKRLQIVAIGVPDEEMQWRGEVEIASI